MVRMFRRTPEAEKKADQSRVVRRVSMLSDPDLISWADTLVTQAGRNLRDYSRPTVRGVEEGAALDEFSLAVEALNAIAAELRRRDI